MLYFIGLGLTPEGISLEGLKILKNKVKDIFLEKYTSIIPYFSIENLEKKVKKKIIVIDREDLENKSGREIILKAKEDNVALLVFGDPFVATTHISLRLYAEKLGIETKTVHAASIFSSAISESGLQVYKFGKSCTIVFPEPNYNPTYPLIVIKENILRGLHTFLFLDYKKEKNKAMSINEGIKVLLELNKNIGENIVNEKALGIGLARVGFSDQIVKAGSFEELIEYDFGSPPHALIIPGDLHPLEKEALIILGKTNEHVIEQWERKVKKLRNISET